MKICLVTYPLIAITIFAGFAAAQTKPSAAPVVPDLSFIGLDEKPWTLSTHRGNVVVLNFWATWCEPCRTEVPYLVKISDEFKKHGVVVAGVSLDGKGSDVVKKFAAQYKINYPILFPEAGSPFSEIQNLPITLLIDRDGRLDQKYTGAVPEKVLREDLNRLATTVTSPSTR